MRQSPSAAHESAWQREPDHDEMQWGVMAWIRQNKKTWVWSNHPDQPHALVSVEAEVSFYSERTRSSAWADIVATYAMDVGKSTERRVLWLLEIKPRIYSAGAVLRQSKTLYAIAKSTLGYGQTVVACPVVRADDPKAQMLANLSNQLVHVWDGGSVSIINSQQLNP